MKLKTIFSRANYIMKGYRKWFRPIAYLIEIRTKKNYIKKLIKEREKLKESVESKKKQVKEFEIKNNEYEKTIEYFKKNFAPKFLTWTNKVVIQKNGNNRYYNGIEITK